MFAVSHASFLLQYSNANRFPTEVNRVTNAQPIVLTATPVTMSVTAPTSTQTTTALDAPPALELVPTESSEKPPGELNSNPSVTHATAVKV